MKLRNVKKLGQGGQGCAWLCEDKSTGERVVAKRTSFFEVNKRGYAKETKILKDLPRHPHVCRLIVWNQGYETLETVYVHCDKGTLRDWIPRSSSDIVSEKRLWHILNQLSQALAFIHFGYDRSVSKKHDRIRPQWKKSVVHRDLSPDNVFLRSNANSPLPDCVLGDFGFATTEPVTFVAMKPVYQGPEFPKLSRRGDVYSLGAVVHLLATGRHVVKDRPHGWSADEWFSSFQSRKIRDLDRKYYSKGLESVMQKCLRDHDRRPTSLELYQLVREMNPYG